MLDRLTIGRMLAWAGAKPVLVALSGGGDSVALLRLLAEQIGAGRLRAAIVDHGLREGSAADASRALAFATDIGVRAEVLRVSWPSAANRAQQAAREARYRILCEHARALGANGIATAHTADDQAETVLMRAARGSTWRGLAGIAPFAFAPLWPEGRGIALARPLLNARREDLRVYLRQRGADWIEDPANVNPAFERVRVRRRLAELERGDFDPMRLTRIAARLRAQAGRIDEAAANLIASAASLGPTIRIARSAWVAPLEVRQRALSALMAAASGASREPSWTDMEELEGCILSQGANGTAHGVHFASTSEGVTLRRDLGAVLGRADGAPPLAPLALTENVEAIWDGRLAVTAPAPGWRIVPVRNGDLAGFEKDAVRQPQAEARAQLRLRWLAAERVAHAFAPDVNRSKT